MLKLFIVSAFFLQSFMVCAQRDYVDILKDIVAQRDTFDKQVDLILGSKKEKRPLTGKELNEIGTELKQRSNIRTEAFSYFEKSRHLLSNKTWKSKNPISKDELKQLIKSLSVSLTLFDLALYSFSTYKESRRVRVIFNEADSAFDLMKNSYNRIAKHIFAMKNRKLLFRAIRLYQNLGLNDADVMNDESMNVAHSMIQNSFYYKKTSENEKWNFFKEVFTSFNGKVGITLRKSADFLKSIGVVTVFGGSKVFGNFSGMFQSRKGKLYKNKEFISHVQQNLQPADIILEKTPFRLTDKFIPGYWGHAAIYIGTIEELKALGIWNHKIVQKHVDKIKDGKLIVEALRSDVQMNTIEHFSDIDDFAILRMKKPLSDQEKAEHILRALSHVGKRYDFGFDVETGKTIVCTELHYRVFITIPFATSTILGRFTISVDEVAEVAKAEGLLGPVLLYKDGKEVKDNIQQVYDNNFKKKKDLQNEKLATEKSNSAQDLQEFSEEDSIEQSSEEFEKELENTPLMVPDVA